MRGQCPTIQWPSNSHAWRHLSRNLWIAWRRIVELLSIGDVKANRSPHQFVACFDFLTEPPDAPKPLSGLPRHPQVRQWTDEAVAKLRAKLIDLSRKSSLIAFKHTSRSASQLRFVDERPDLLFEKLSSGSMGFEPLPGEEQTPVDERTPTFGIAYERVVPIKLLNSEMLTTLDDLP